LSPKGRRRKAFDPTKIRDLDKVCKQAGYGKAAAEERRFIRGLFPNSLRRRQMARQVLELLTDEPELLLQVVLEAFPERDRRCAWRVINAMAKAGLVNRKKAEKPKKPKKPEKIEADKPDGEDETGAETEADRRKSILKLSERAAKKMHRRGDELWRILRYRRGRNRTFVDMGLSGG